MKQSVIGILNDVIKLDAYVLQVFVEKGILYFLLKIMFDPDLNNLAVKREAKFEKTKLEQLNSFGRSQTMKQPKMAGE